MTSANQTGAIAIPQWLTSQNLTIEEIGIYTILAIQYQYQEIQPNPAGLATTTGCPQQKIKDLLNTLVTKGLLAKGSSGAYQLQFGNLLPPGNPAPAPAPTVEHQAAQQLVQELSATMPELARALGGNTKSLIPLIGETLDRGISPSQIRQAIGARTLVDMDNPSGAVAYRLRGLLPHRDEIRRQPGCPLHRGQTWDHCRCCKGEIKEGQDPYAGREALRPDGWFSAYPEARSLVDTNLGVTTCS